jgi:hypothetical protein
MRNERPFLSGGASGSNRSGAVVGIADAATTPIYKIGFSQRPHPKCQRRQRIAAHVRHSSLPDLGCKTIVPSTESHGLVADVDSTFRQRDPRRCAMTAFTPPTRVPVTAPAIGRHLAFRGHDGSHEIAASSQAPVEIELENDPHPNGPYQELRALAESGDQLTVGW